MIKSKKTVSPAQYLQLVLGTLHNVSNTDPCGEIKAILEAHGLYKHNFALDEVAYALSAGLDVVLVDCSYEKNTVTIQDLRWFAL